MSRGKRYKSKSDYTLLRNRHQGVPQGTIFEHDHMTISKFDEYFSEQVPVYSDSNFKFSVRPGSNQTKKHTRLNWVCPDGSDSNEDCYWTLENIPDVAKQEESSPKPKADYTTLRSFAYYGSAVDLINATINGVISDFPAELYFSNKEYYINSGRVDVDGNAIFDKYYLISNPFRIDIHNRSIAASEVQDTLRHFCLSADKYELIYTDSVESLADFEEPWYSEIHGGSCQSEKEDNGAEIATVYLADRSIEIKVRYSRDMGYMWLYSDENLVGLHIRPNKDIVEKYFATLDVFTSVLLDRTTSPIYRCNLETVTFDNENGYTYKIKPYVWPTVGGYNPDIADENGYSLYVEDLINVASYYDTVDSDNIWRVMTHEAIKNLDWTFSSDERNPIDELHPLDATKIEAMCKIYGRQYDDLKLYIDSIKFTNTVTYDMKNNVPDYCLSDLLEANGWEPRNLNFYCDNTLRTKPLYPSEGVGYNSSDVNIAFMNRLLLNTRYIYSIKGTRVGIDTVMGMFGFDADEYEVFEHVGVAMPLDYSYIILDTATKVSGFEAFISCEFSRYEKQDLHDSQGNNYYCWRKVKNGLDYLLYTNTEYVGDATTKVYYKVEVAYGNIELRYAGTARMLYDDEIGQTIPGMICSYPKYSIVTEYNQRKDTYQNDKSKHKVSTPLDGIYAHYVYVEDENGNDLSYVIPWCDKTWHDGKCIFHSRGGWLGESKRDINLEQFASVKKLISVPGDNFGLYNETQPIVKFVENLSDLVEYGEENLKDGDICYVTNISSLKTAYSCKDSAEMVHINKSDATHYFILKNKKLSSTLGYYKSGDSDVIRSQYGWRCVMNFEVDNTTLTTDGKKVIYAESIMKSCDGNNPHIGGGRYDGGDEYVTESSKLLNWSVRNDNFTTLSEHEFGQADRIGFNVVEVIDNRKVWFFGNEDNPVALMYLNGDSGVTKNPDVRIGKAADKNYSDDYLGVSYASDLFTYNPEAEQMPSELFIDNREPAANSVINLKTVRIVFKPKRFIDESNKFFKETVMPYLSAVIPSTVITKVEFLESSYAGITSDGPVTTIENTSCPAIRIVEEEVDGTIGCVC